MRPIPMTTKLRPPHPLPEIGLIEFGSLSWSRAPICRIVQAGLPQLGWDTTTFDLQLGQKTGPGSPVFPDPPRAGTHQNLDRKTKEG